MTTIYDNDLRNLSDNELIYNISNKQVENEQPSFEEFINSLSPSKKKLALNVIELFRRNVEKKSEQSTITCSNSIYSLMKPKVYGLDHEEFWVIYMNQGSKPIKVERLSKGGLTATLIDVRLILKTAFLCNATCAAICHNHPSGNTRPSMDDDNMTNKIKEAFKTCNIRLLDHVIVSDESFYSYADEGRF